MKGLIAALAIAIGALFFRVRRDGVVKHDTLKRMRDASEKNHDLDDAAVDDWLRNRAKER